MKQKCWKIWCTKHDNDIGFGLDCFLCKDIERPHPSRFKPDMRMCIHEKYLEETEREV